MATITEELLILIKSVGGMGAASDVEKVAGATTRSGNAAKAAAGEHLGFKSALGSLKGIAFQAAGMAGIGGLAVGIGAAVKAAQSMQVQNARLGTAIKNNVRFPAKDATEQMDKFAESLAMKGGFAPTEALQAMARLVGVTHDMNKTQKDLALASDIARGTNVGLGQATRAVMMVEAGRTTGLSRMGIFLKQNKDAENALAAAKGKHTQAEKDAAKIQDANATRLQGMTALWQRFGHQTDSYSHTAAGAISNLRNTVEVLAERLGAKLLPTIAHVAQAFSGFVTGIMEGRGVGGEVAKVIGDMAKAALDLLKWLRPLEPLVLALAAAWAVYKVEQIASAALTAVTTSALIANTTATYAELGASAALTTVLEELNLTILASPWFWVVAAIVAVVAAFLLLWNHCKAFRDFWKSMWKDIQIAFKAASDWITQAWRNTVQWLGNAASNAKRWITGAFHDVIAWFKQNWPYLLGVLTGPFGLAAAWIYKHWNQVKKLPGEIIKAFQSAAGAILNAITWPFKEAFKWISHHLPSFHVHHIGPIPIPLPSFPGLATGGVTPYGGAFVVGEKGPELVTLPQGANVSSQDDLKQTNQLLRELIAAVQANSNALVVDGKVLAQSVMRQGLLQASRS